MISGEREPADYTTTVGPDGEVRRLGRSALPRQESSCQRQAWVSRVGVNGVATFEHNLPYGCGNGSKEVSTEIRKASQSHAFDWQTPGEYKDGRMARPMKNIQGQEAPRGMNFLYSLNRLNVATACARASSILVCSPALIEPECRTPEQMRMANAFCRYMEMATNI